MQERFRSTEQLASERGHLRNITESALQEDIDAGKELPEHAADAEKQSDAQKEAPSQQEQREKIEMILKMLSLNEKEIFEDYFMCEKSAREIQQANGGTLEGIRAAIRIIRKKARLVEQGKNYFILCILGTLLIIRQIIK